ncbi:DNA-directed RNA polymerase I subunit rpa49 [Coemansia sp. S16]|nr:DNA-directed RNA polymerase I subunit rpa49 [Coemansia sp. S3946]KAJ2052662.1 DNA-directed RNA polymerase I subunit rpa49 [Coemansia sp. S16]KAJ2063214.1 DNA-directed RNA polymerase I subunit rpa49 [Coemansia sp. S2]
MGTKRKQAEVSSNNATSDTTGQEVSISIDRSPANIQPVLAKFLAAVPPVASSFSTYKYISNTKNDDCIVVSETDKVEYVGQNFENGKPLINGCRYMIGVYDPKKDTVVFRQAPYVRVNTVIKSLKNSRGVAERTNQDQVMQARNDLGVEFGSKKQKAGIRAEERNKINMDSVRADMDVIGASIEQRTSSMPTAQDIAKDNEKARPVPKYDPDAKTAAEIYDMEDVLSKSNAAFINALALSKATDAEEHRKLVPVRSEFVAKKIEQIVGQKKPDLDLLRRVMYLAYLIKFVNIGRKAMQSRETCVRTLCCSPEIANVIFDKFADCVAGAANPDGSPVYIKTAASESKLMCHIFVLMLSLNNWILIPTEVAADLGMEVRTAMRYLGSVGCKMEALSSSGDAATKSRKAASSNKKAVLKAPIKFPKANLRGKN